VVRATILGGLTFFGFSLRENVPSSESVAYPHAGGPPVTDRDETRDLHSDPPTATFDPALDAGLAAAFGAELTPGG
jgi:hypothetical protein